MDSIEQRLMMMLQQLPVPITITWHGSLYRWQCMEQTGIPPDLVRATEQALRTMIELVATDAAPVTSGAKANTGV
jgi:hypothetical protein